MRSPLATPFFRLAVWLLCAAGCSMAGYAQAPANPNRVTFYTQPNFRGEALAVEAGASVTDLGTMMRPSNQPWALAISSIKVEGDARALVYSGRGFSGERLEVRTSIADLYGETRGGGTWDRAIASVTVSGTQMHAPAPPPPQVVVRPAPPPPSRVVVVPPPPPPVRRIDMRAVDNMIYHAYREVLRRNPDPDGLRTYRHRIIYEGWSMDQVIAQLQRSSEARGVDPQAAITQAYREVLGRDPDPQGMAHYLSKWRDGWTQGQIRDDLRRSAEARNRRR
ncbi:MAG TPA: DUF4214 domain-containing protein [Opitutaceae bacterium]